MLKVRLPKTALRVDIGLCAELGNDSREDKTREPGTAEPMDPFTASTGQAGSGDTDTLVFSGSPASRAGTPLTEERRLEPQTSVSRASVQANTKRVIGQFECAIRSGNLPIRSQLHHPPPCP